MCKKTLLVLSIIQINNKQEMTLENWQCKLEQTDPLWQKDCIQSTENNDYNFCMWPQKYKGHEYIGQYVGDILSPPFCNKGNHNHKAAQMCKTHLRSTFF